MALLPGYPNSASRCPHSVTQGYARYVPTWSSPVSFLRPALNNGRRPPHQAAFPSICASTLLPPNIFVHQHTARWFNPTCWPFEDVFLPHPGFGVPWFHHSVPGLIRDNNVFSLGRVCLIRPHENTFDILLPIKSTMSTGKGSTSNFIRPSSPIVK
jgi:hypothetical protein